jgi:hypothetical protein
MAKAAAKPIKCSVVDDGCRVPRLNHENTSMSEQLTTISANAVRLVRRCRRGLGPAVSPVTTSPRTSRRPTSN